MKLERRIRIFNPDFKIIRHFKLILNFEITLGSQNGRSIVPMCKYRALTGNAIGVTALPQKEKLKTKTLQKISK